MAAGGRGITVSFNEDALAELFTSPAGPVAKFLERVGEAVSQEAKRLAPVSPQGSGGRPSGYLRSQIGWEILNDGSALLVRISSPATTPTGEPYGLFNEVGTRKMAAQPHLRPALDAARRVT